MTDDEWATIVLWMEKVFGGDLTDERAGVYAHFFKDRARDEVMHGIDVLVLNGAKWLPKPGELVEAMRPALPTFTEAWARVLPFLNDAPYRKDSETIRLVTEACGELIGGWVAMYGPKRLANEPCNDDRAGGATMHRIEQSYKDAIANSQQRARTSEYGLRVLTTAKRPSLALVAELTA